MSNVAVDKRRSERTSIHLPCLCAVLERDSEKKLVTFRGAVTDTTFSGCRVESKDFPTEHLLGLTRGELLMNCAVQVNGQEVSATGQLRWSIERQPFVWGLEFLAAADAVKAKELHAAVHKQQHAFAKRGIAVVLAAAALFVGLWVAQEDRNRESPQVNVSPPTHGLRISTPQISHTRDAESDVQRTDVPSQPLAEVASPAPEQLPDGETNLPSPPAPLFFSMVNVEQRPAEFAAVFRVNRTDASMVKFRFQDQSGTRIDDCQLRPEGSDVTVSCRLAAGQQVTQILPYE